MLHWGAVGMPHLGRNCPALRYRIPSSPMPWSALHQPGCSQPAPPQQAVFGQRLDGVLTTGRDEPAGRRSQRRHHMPVQLDQEDQPACCHRAGPAESAGHRLHRPGPVAWRIRSNPVRSCCSSRGEIACRLLGSARITTWSTSSKSGNTARATCRNRRATRCRSTAEPTDFAMINPIFADGAGGPCRAWITTSGCTARRPCLTVASKSADRVMRLRAGSTALTPGEGSGSE